MLIQRNPDVEYANEIRRQIKDNNGFCPCKIERTKDNKCMCKEFRDMVERGESGSCHCGLYIASQI